MPIPRLMTQADWLRDTNRKAWHGQSLKERSTELDLVDQQLLAYETTPTPSTLENLHAMLTRWAAGKTKDDGTLKTIRDHKGAVTRLLDQVELAMTLFSPVPTRYTKILIGVDNYRGNDWVPDGFKGAIEEALVQIASKPIGKKLLEDIGKKCTGTKQVVIEYGKLSTAAPLAVIDNLSRKKVQPKIGEDRYNLSEMMRNPDLIGRVVDGDGGKKDFVPAAGTGAVITFNHEDKGLDGRPTFIALAHELVHAFHYVSGACYRAADGGLQDNGNTGLMEEEMRTVGCQKFADETPSENAIRAEHGITLRKTYNDTISFANVARTYG